MKLSNLSTVTVFAFALSLAAIGCRTRSSMVTPLASSAGTAHQPVAATAPGNPLTTDGQPVSQDVTSSSNNSLTDPAIRKDWPRDREIFNADTVHFDYDSSNIKESDKSKVALVADYMKGHAGDAVEIEGHCDERGTEEYNRSLGERRALALREELVRLGIEPGRIDTLSFGEDRPVDTAHNEAAYKQNRRGEFVLEKHETLVGAK